MEFSFKIKTCVVFVFTLKLRVDAVVEIGVDVLAVDEVVLRGELIGDIEGVPMNRIGSPKCDDL
jgi:hypothetical protein